MGGEIADIYPDILLLMMMWRLERYARFTGGEQQLFSGGYGGTQSTQADGNWRVSCAGFTTVVTISFLQHYSSTSENIIQLALVDVHYLTITCGSDIYVRITLIKYIIITLCHSGLTGKSVTMGVKEVAENN